MLYRIFAMKWKLKCFKNTHGFNKFIRNQVMFLSFVFNDTYFFSISLLPQSPSLRQQA